MDSLTAFQHFEIGFSVHENVWPVITQIHEAMWIDIVDDWAERAHQMIEERWAWDEAIFAEYFLSIFDGKRWDLIFATNASY